MNKETIKAIVRDAVSDILYYDRKEDDEIPVGMIDKMILDGELTIEELVEEFREALYDGIQGMIK